MGFKKDLSNKIYDNLKVLKYDELCKKWICECKCGNITRVRTSDLNSGNSKSCGNCFENNVNKNFFDIIDTEEKAYILGLFYADGYNNENNKYIRLDLTETDQEILEKIKVAMDFMGEIKIYNNNPSRFGGDNLYSIKPSARLLIHNTRISEQLALKGCTNNKTYNVTFPNNKTLPTQLHNHFIRGVMDGDGTIAFSKNKVCIAITGTLELCNSIKVIFDKITGGTSTISYHKNFNINNNVTVSLGGNRQSEKLLDWIYNNSTIYLERKHNKYLELKSINKIKPKPQPKSKCVDQLDLKGSYVNTYRSITEAGKSTNINPKYISACLNGRSKTAGGYKWCFVN